MNDMNTAVCFCRASFGSSCIVEDQRWAGTYGVDADFVALSNCSIEFVPIAAINVRGP